MGLLPLIYMHLDTLNCFPEIKLAGDEIRTRDIYLGKVVLYQLSYSR